MKKADKRWILLKVFLFGTVCDEFPYIIRGIKSKFAFFSLLEVMDSVWG